MIYLVGEMSNGSAKLADTYPRGIGRCYVERPLEPFPGEPWILDNGVFRAWNAAGRDPSIDYADCYAAFEARLENVAELVREDRGPLFVVVPDRPADPSSFWTSLAWLDDYEQERQEELDPSGWYHGARMIPLFLAVQNGMTPELLEAERCAETDRPLLERVDGLFLGGTDEFKADTLDAWRELADRHGLRLHFGRCTQSRIAAALEAGCDSADSSHPNRLGGERWARFLEAFDAVQAARSVA
ncbi:MAG: hypothetical protein OEW52_00265 [Thermoleophilia bacterium]|nr:hypothetical protein [Thermoleophilia bacterium]